MSFYTNNYKNEEEKKMSKDTTVKQVPSSTMAVLPMRFYANWDMDRSASPIIMQRVLSMVLTRLVFNKSLPTLENAPITIAIRHNKRTLRTNDLSIPPSNLNLPLDISFVIQYCHYIKRKPNILQILIQRRKRYKNRQIPGFKTLAMGHLNLDEIMQFGGSREITIWDTTCIQQQKVRHSMRELNAGRIEIANCYSKAAETSENYGASTSRQRIVATINEKEQMVLSEEEPEEFSSVEDSESDLEFTPRTSGGKADRRARPGARYMEQRQKKFLKQRNIKQKVIALLRRFKPDEVTTEGPQTSGSAAQPTEQELQELFEELENISGDSGPEIEDDKLSIVSNPRPKIRPFFGSRSDIMPPIMDIQNEDGLFLSDELSAESEVGSSAEERNKPEQEAPPSLNIRNHTRNGSTLSQQQQQQQYYSSALLKHSDTAHSVMSTDPRSKEPIEELLSKLCTTTTHIIPEHIWICSSAELPWILKLNNKLLEPIFLFDCPSPSNVRSVLQAIIGKIQNFCNNNSISPPTMTIGVLGGDMLLANVLKSYVVLLQDKACKEDWLNYLRFSLVLPPSTAVGRLLSQVGGFGGYSEAIWKILSQVSAAFKSDTDHIGPAEHFEIRNCLIGITREPEREQARFTNLHIGEVMLQLIKQDPSNKSAEAESQSQAFVPFLAELLTGSSIYGEQQPSSSSTSASTSTTTPPDHPFSTLHYLGRNPGIGDERQTEVPPLSAGVFASTSSSSSAKPSPQQPQHQYSKSFPTIPNLIDPPTGNRMGNEKELQESEDALEKNSPPQQSHIKFASSPLSSTEGRDLQIEYWTSLNYPCSSTSTPNQSSSFHHHHSHQREDGQSPAAGKFSMKASVRTLSIAREPMSNLLSILFVKERKKDKVLHKLGRRSKQKSTESMGGGGGPAGFSSQSRVVSGVTRIVCSGAGGMGSSKKGNDGAAMDVSIDGVVWRGVRFFQISAQWQTHVKLFPVSFPMELPMIINK